MKDSDQKLIFEAYSMSSSRNAWYHGNKDGESGDFPSLDRHDIDPGLRDDYMLGFEQGEKAHAKANPDFDEDDKEDINAAISGERWSEEGQGFDANADLKQEASDIVDLVEAFYSNDYSPETHDEVAKVLYVAKKALEKEVGIDTDFDVHGKPSGPSDNYQDRAFKAGQEFGKQSPEDSQV